MRDLVHGGLKLARAVIQSYADSVVVADERNIRIAVAVEIRKCHSGHLLALQRGDGGAKCSIAVAGQYGHQSAIQNPRILIGAVDDIRLPIFIDVCNGDAQFVIQRIVVGGQGIVRLRLERTISIRQVHLDRTGVIGIGARQIRQTVSVQIAGGYRGRPGRDQNRGLELAIAHACVEVEAGIVSAAAVGTNRQVQQTVANEILQVADTGGESQAPADTQDDHLTGEVPARETSEARRRVRLVSLSMLANGWKRCVIPHSSRLPQMPPLVGGNPGEGELQVEPEQPRLRRGHFDVRQIQPTGLP